MARSWPLVPMRAANAWDCCCVGGCSSSSERTGLRHPCRMGEEGICVVSGGGKARMSFARHGVSPARHMRASALGTP